MAKKKSDKTFTQKEYKAALDQVIRLCSCALKNEAPAKEFLEGIDYSLLYNVSEMHMLSALIGYALKLAGVNKPPFIQAEAKAIRKLGLMDAEMSVIFSKMEEEGIWYLPLKGTLLKDYYPSYGLRQMSDHDILFDAKRANDVKDIMVGLGYTVKLFDRYHHDSYHKEPVCNFEMHRMLFNKSYNETFYNYYSDIKSRLVKNEGSNFGYHFTPEDFYVYMVAHEYKHFSADGTGLRSLVDTYVYLKRFNLNMNYVEKEIDKLGISEFEKSNRNLSLHLFDTGKLNAEEYKMLLYIFNSGTYGNIKNKVEKDVKEMGRWKYFKSRLFTTKEIMLNDFPILRKLPFLYPVFFIIRRFRGLFFRREKFMAQLKGAIKGKV